MNLKQERPDDGVTGLKRHWKTDLISGFLVFLIALPLCLGIAMASGFPPVSGIITAVIGGLFVSPFMGSRLSIKGPAAGLIAIALAAVAELGQGDVVAGYRYALAVVVISGIVQLIFGLLKLGRFVDFFPKAAVHGMLAAIGIIIIAKQFPIMIGAITERTNPIALIAEFPAMLLRLHPQIAFIGGLSLLILFGLPLIKTSWARRIPAPLVVLFTAVPLAYFFEFGLQETQSALGEISSIPQMLVAVPGDITDSIVFPDFSILLTLPSLKYIAMFTLVGSIESLLTVRAIDGLDPWHRKSDTNRDIIAVGAGNALAGFLGGLPMIAEVVRSSANIENGAKTRWSNFFHGGFLLLFVAVFPNLIQKIPLAALAAMLVYIGYKLASPKLFRETLKIGKEQLAVFVITIVFTLAIDLLVGIAAGILFEMGFYFFNGVKLRNLVWADLEVDKSENGIRLSVKNAALFSNYLGFRSKFRSLPKQKSVEIDFSGTSLVDHTFAEQLMHLKQDYELAGGQVSLVDWDQLEPVSNHPYSARKSN